MKAGKTVSAADIVNGQDGENKYPCYGGNGPRGYVRRYSQEGDYIVIGRQGALCGNVHFASGKFYATEHAVVVTPKKDIDTKFLYYLLDAMDLNRYKTSGAQPGLSVLKLEKLVASIPHFEEQRRIVVILDRFDALCNNLTNGLPAEIETRRMQYEYYRDKLLTFKEKSA